MQDPNEYPGDYPLPAEPERDNVEPSDNGITTGADLFASEDDLRQLEADCRPGEHDNN